MLGNLLFVALLGAFSLALVNVWIASGHFPWDQLYGTAALALLVAGVGLALVLVVLAIIDYPDRRRMKVAEAKRLSIESRFPGARVTALSSGNWLVTDRSTGRTRFELTASGDPARQVDPAAGLRVAAEQSSETGSERASPAP